MSQIAGQYRLSPFKDRIGRLAGPLLILYMLLLLGVTSLAQRDFRSSYTTQLQLDLDKRAAALSYFYQERINDIRTLSSDSALEAYFANEALGMSMEYGLRASLLKASRILREKAEATTLGGQTVFSRIVFTRMDSSILLDTSNDTLRAGRFPVLASQTTQEVEIIADANTVVLSQPYLYKGKMHGRLLAFVNHEQAFRQLVYEGSSPAASRIVLLIEGRTAASIDKRPGSIRVQAGVKATPFRLEAHYYPTGMTSYLTSGWSSALLALLTVFILAGVAIAKRIRSQNSILYGRFEESARHRELLHQQNRQLQEEIHKRQDYEALLSRQANFDELTGLPNRSLGMERMSQALANQQAVDELVVVLLVDLDRFKQVNDTLGHAAGDRLLVEAAQRLLDSVRESDTVARLGGDEFMILLPALNKRESAGLICRKILDSFSLPFVTANYEFFLTTSIGVAIAPDDGDDPHTLLKNADIALYKAKDEGRNTLRFFTPEMNERLKARQSMENLLIHALERNELFLLYQPVVCVTDPIIIGAEALLRWRNSALGLVSPDQFIPLCEDMGIIEEIGEWVLIQACNQASHWQSIGPLRLSVNISSVQLRVPGTFLEMVGGILKRSGLPASNLELEVTERVVLDDSSTNQSVLRGLDSLGVRLSIDDFGTGFSALGYLKKFPFDTLKIDKSFVHDLPHDAGSVALARAILAMAHALGLDVIAEGIENSAQADFLASQHCDFAQGYHFHKPMPAEDLTALLSAQSSKHSTSHNSAAVR